VFGIFGGVRIVSEVRFVSLGTRVGYQTSGMEFASHEATLALASGTADSLRSTSTCTRARRMSAVHRLRDFKRSTPPKINALSSTKKYSNS
jgi:hypothetical protein